MQREFPVVIRKSGDKLIPKFPIDLEEGDQLIIVREMRGSRVPDGKRWTINGYSASGPIIQND